MILDQAKRPDEPADPPTVDPELNAMRVCVERLGRLTERPRARVLDYLVARYAPSRTAGEDRS